MHTLSAARLSETWHQLTQIISVPDGLSSAKGQPDCSHGDWAEFQDSEWN